MESRDQTGDLDPAVEIIVENETEYYDTTFKSSLRPNNLSQYTCDICNKSFSKLGHLKNHMLNHYENGFTKVIYHKKHMMFHGDKRHICDTCGKAFTFLGDLRNHKRIHTGEKPYKCDFCKRKFRIAGMLSVHLRTHTGERPYRCESCGQSFSQSQNLRNHKRIHTGEKPYKCDFCERTFRVARTLTDHLRIHTGERPYKCESCGQSFTHLGSLKKHSLKHTKSSPIQNEDHSSHKQKKAKLYTGTSADEQFDQTVFSEVSTKRNTVTWSDTAAVAKESTLQPKILYGEKTELALPNDLKNDNGIQSGEKPNSCKNDPTVNHTFKQTVNFKAKTDKGIQSVHGLDNSLVHINCSSLKQEVTETYNESTEQPGDTRQERVTVSKLIPISKTITPKSSPVPNKTAQFICGICSKTFAKLIYLKKHMVFHGDKRHICETCGKAFTLPGDLRHHKYIHTGEKPYKCDFCERKFRVACTLSAHLRTHTGERPFKCKSCALTFIQLGSLKKHSLKHAKSTPIQNEDHSRKSLHSKANHKQKKAKLYTGKSVDEQCDQAVFSKVSTKRNTVTRSDTTAVAKESTLQPKILYGEKTELALPNDLKNDNGIQSGDTRQERVTVSKLIPISKTITPKSSPVPNKTAQFICGICSKTFAKLIYLKKHMVFIHGDKRHICETCGKAFSLPGDLRHHKYIHHICETCGKSFTLSHDLRIHKRKHSCEELYKCKSCGRSFTQFGNLKRHYLKHAQPSHIQDKDDAQFICGICSKTFAKLIYLKKHMVFHGDKRHICETCGKAFTLPGDLRHHKYIHTGEKPYKCDFCESKFRLACRLSAHLRTHTDERPFKCKSCALTFIQLGSLKKHSLKHAKSTPIQNEDHSRKSLHSKANHKQKKEKLYTGKSVDEQCDQAVFSKVSTKRNTVTRSDTTALAKESTLQPKILYGEKTELALPNDLKNDNGIQSGEKPNSCKNDPTVNHTFKQTVNFKAKTDKGIQSVHGLDNSLVHINCSSLKQDVTETYNESTEQPGDTRQERVTVSKLIPISKTITPKSSPMPNKTAQFICGICSKTFAKLIYLKKHMVFHGDKRHICETCGKAFTLPDDLKHHKYIHTGEKPYKCDFCERKFRVACTLSVHLRTHTGERPYKCESCGQSFTYLGSLKRHSLKHTKSNPIQNEDHSSHKQKKAKLYIGTSADEQFDQTIFSEVSTKRNTVTGSDTAAVANESTMQPKILYGEKTELALPNDLKNDNGIQSGENPNSCKNDSTVNHTFKQTVNFKTKTDKDIQSVHGLDNSLIHIDCSSLKQEVTETGNESTEQSGDTRKERVTVSK